VITMASVDLSEKSLKLIEMRRGDRPVGQYLNMVMENIYDKMSSTGLIINGTNLFDILESRTAPPAAVAAAAAQVAGDVSAAKIQAIIKQLKATSPSKIPYNLFYQECVEQGISRADIETATQNNRGIFQIQVYNDDEYAKLLLVIIYNYLKETYNTTMSTSQFYGKCLEEGLSIDDIRFAESVWQIAIPDQATLKELAAKTDSMGIENRLLKLLYAMKSEYPGTIPLAVLGTKCSQFGMTKEDVGNLEKIYTRHLLSKHNEKISGEKKVLTDVNAAAAPSIKDINAKVKRVLDDAINVYGDTVPEMAFIDKCKNDGFTLEEQMYARKVFEDYLASLVSYKEIKYMNKKAHIILTSLRKIYPGKIPYNIFYNKCKALGMKNEEIADAIKQSGNMISTEKSDEQHYLKVLEDIIGDQKKAST
jgi:hypothetical protein